MQLSSHTLQVLKNFATINAGLLVQPNAKELKTVSTSKSIFAKASIEDDFPARFAIYDLSQFLSTLSLFKEPELQFNESDSYVTISEGSSDSRNSSCHYHFASENLIMTPPEKDINLPKTEIEFRLEKNTLNNLQKAAATLGVPDLSVEKRDDQIVLVVKDKKNSSSNDYQIPVGEFNQNNTFEFHIQTDNLKLMADDYNVKISSAGIAHFESENLGVEYYVALEATSTSDFE